ncbi:MAG TPA: hypothetical protein VF103_09105 [Polyangiaceae bacterium]
MVQALAILPIVAYLTLSALTARAGLDAMTHVLEPIQNASSDAPTEPGSAVSLGGDSLP